MVIKTDDTFLRVKVVHSIVINSVENREIIDNGWFKPKKVIKTTSYKLTMRFLGEDGNEASTFWTCPVKSTLEKLYKDLVEQVKAQDNDYVDRLLENAIIGGGTK